MERGITVAEVTYCNSISVSEHVVMMILGLVRNYIPSWQWVVKGGWNIADCAAREYDLEGMHVGTVAAGRIGLAVLRRLKPFDVKLHYTDRHRLPADVEKELGLTFHNRRPYMVPFCDVVTIIGALEADEATCKMRGHPAGRRQRRVGQGDPRPLPRNARLVTAPFPSPSALRSASSAAASPASASSSPASCSASRPSPGSARSPAA